MKSQAFPWSTQNPVFVLQCTSFLWKQFLRWLPTCPISWCSHPCVVSSLWVRSFLLTGFWWKEYNNNKKEYNKSNRMWCDHKAYDSRLSCWPSLPGREASCHVVRHSMEGQGLRLEGGVLPTACDGVRHHSDQLQGTKSCQRPCECARKQILPGWAFRWLQPLKD